MELIGWTVVRLNNTNIFIRPIKPFNFSLMKIQHAKEKPDFQKIDELAKKHNTIFTIIEPASVEYGEEIFKKHGYKHSRLKSAFTSTILVDLTPSEEQIFKSFSENIRRNIKKAQNNKVTVKHIYTKNEKTNNEFNKFYKLYKELGKNKGFYVLPYEECLNKLCSFRENSFISFAYEDGNPDPIAVVWYLYFENTVIYNQTGITTKGYELHANALLVWEGIKEAKKNGIKVLDFESIYDSRYPSENKKWLGYSNFKKKFHGEIILYPHSWIKIYSLPYKLFYLCMSSFFRY